MSDTCHTCHKMWDGSDIIPICKICLNDLINQYDDAIKMLENADAHLDKIISLLDRAERLMKQIEDDTP